MQTRRWLLSVPLFALFFLLLHQNSAYLAPATPNSTPQGGGMGATPWQCWDDGTIDPCHHTLNGLDGIAATDVWAVGEGSTVLHYDGANWSHVAFPQDDLILSDVDMLAANSVWVLASRLWKWDGSEWESFGDGNRTLLALSMISETSGWAVGYDGEIRQFDGTTFALVPSPASGNSLYDVQMVSATDGWAVGQNGTILRYNGSSWQSVTSPTSNVLTNVYMRSPTEGYIVGDGVFLTWNGSSWTVATTTPGYFSGLVMVSATEGYASNYGGIYRWNGSSWSLEREMPNVYLQEFVSFPGLVMTVGNGGLILERDTGGWQSVNTPFYDYLYAVEARSDNNIWAVGNQGAILQYDGTTWNPHSYTPLPTSSTNPTLYDVSFLSNTDGWIVGSNVIVRWDGDVWTEVDKGTTDYHGYQAVDALAANDVWVVGELSGGSGSVIRHWNGSVWSSSPHPSASILTSIDMVDSANGFAGGYRYNSGTGSYEAVLLRWNGSSWSEVTIPNTADIQDMVLEDANNGWFVGNGGVLRMQDGAFTLLNNATGYGIDFSDSNNGWAVGAAGHRWNGATWNQEQYFSQYVYDVEVLEDGTGWAVAEEGAIYHFEPPIQTFLPLIRRAE